MTFQRVDHYQIKLSAVISSGIAHQKHFHLSAQSNPVKDHSGHADGAWRVRDIN
jgi:hypothetical protein